MKEAYFLRICDALAKTGLFMGLLENVKNKNLNEENLDIVLAIGINNAINLYCDIWALLLLYLPGNYVAFSVRR